MVSNIRFVTCVYIVEWLKNLMVQKGLSLWAISNCMCIITICTTDTALVFTQPWATHPISIILYFMRCVHILFFAVVLAKHTKLQMTKERKKNNAFGMRIVRQKKKTNPKRKKKLNTILGQRVKKKVEFESKQKYSLHLLLLLLVILMAISFVHCTVVVIVLAAAVASVDVACWQ